jgi:succinate dehydrogenase / fumarate reductase flavoprotein subunit
VARLEDLGEVISTDVLVVGGGIGGLTAAIKAKEQPVDVLIVDKGSVGWSGKAPKGGGIVLVLMPGADLDKFAEYHVKKIGHYLNDQELLYKMASATYPVLMELEKWGVKPMRDAEGKLELAKWGADLPWSIGAVDLDMLLPLRARARKLGVKTVDKVAVIELLRQGQRVVGAVGFNVFDGRFYIIKAKATILASGGCNYYIKRMWSSGGGEGIAAAYRAGAQMRNAEFGNFYDLIRVATMDVGGGQENIINAKGENIFQKYVHEPQCDIAVETLLGIDKEIREGRGPIYTDPSRMASARRSLGWKRPYSDGWRARLAAKTAKYAPAEKVEITAGLTAELAPIKVDHDMKTTLDGLWAIGDTSYGGSGWAGAVPAPPARIRSSGLVNAYLAAFRGGPPAARYAAQAAAPRVSTAQVQELKERIFAPMQRKRGLDPWDAIHAIQDVVYPMKYNLRRSKDRMEEGLAKIEAVRNRLPELFAEEPRVLVKCHEAKSFALGAEMTFKAALMRTESRGWHFREDYPQQDDKNWLKWIIVKQDSAGKMALSTEPIPINKYKFKP